MIRSTRRPALFLTAALLATLSAGGLAPATADPADDARYAAIVVDARTGEVLFSRRADASRYPASITKVMTMYMAFEALEQGRVSLDDRVVISPRAASQPPSKLGLPAGRTISLDNALKAMAVKSANDMAMAVAEHIGGSEAAFTAQMTLRARELGMDETRFVNPHGLPDSRNISTARDIALLSRAMMRDFPQYYSYFSTREWEFEGRTYRNTNGLLHSMPGVDGIKTGYTNASGYNLAASAVRGDRRLIAVVLGGRTSRTRNDHMSTLIETGFEVENRREHGELIPVAQTFFETALSPRLPSGPIQYAELRTGEAGVTLAADARVTETANLGEARDLTAALNGASGDATSPPAPARRPAAPPPTRSRPSGDWIVQVGAFRSRSDAQGWIRTVSRRFSSHFRGAESDIQTANGWYRSRFTGLTQEAARAACAAMTQARLDCIARRG
ncbi:D-alanyl-D-alanine carboxypeptidase [Brevundimonas sp. 2R-24]|uniref:D-alanyl-D-alanine carboxypeptidase n=1 Tax=Peiella sedimenti TaxID=3061083 RepID=A0ABT8SIQ6_9CAUL|nr:D-alanyl-D-alanine carboxypeptidase [Caulobacteraceae bacterium XZ-24]